MPISRSNILTAWILALFSLLLLSSCGRSTIQDLPPEEIVQKAAQRMKSLAGFQFLIDRTGSPAYLDVNKTFSFRRAEGYFVSPDKAEATVRVLTPAMVAEIQIIGMGERYWETNVLTGQWMELPPEEGFNPAVLFDPEIGIQPIIETDLMELELLGTDELEEMPGKKLYYIKGKMDGERIFPMSYGLIGPDVMDIQLWVDPQTFDLHRILITQEREDDEPTLWQVDFWDFDKVIEINPPESSEGEP